MKCAFCQDEATADCAARVRSEAAIIFPEEIQLNDLYLSGPDLIEHRVMRVERGEFLRRVGEHDPIIILDLETQDGRRRVEVHHLNLGVLVKRFVRCGAPCCWRHYREVSDGIYRCKNHWMIGSEEIPDEQRKPDNRSLHKHWRKPKPRAHSIAP